MAASSGFLRLRQIALVAAELAPVVDALHDVFGLDVAFRDPGVAQFGLENAVLPVGHQFLEVVAPTRDGTAGGRYLERRGGDGGYMVILQTDDHGPAKARAKAASIRSALEFEEPRYHIWQLHPADTGGSFLEVDVQEGGEASDGPWSPAGKTWQEAIRTRVVRGIDAAEIQSPDPAPLAERWAGILDRPVNTEGAHPSIHLDNAVLRFVFATDGRGEGLGGIDLAATDRAAALGAAERRGLAVDGDTILLGGMRCRLLGG
jgi:hypothetical protein